MERYFPKVAKASTSTSKKPRYHPYNHQCPLTPGKKSTEEESMFEWSMSRECGHSNYKVQAISKPTIKELNKVLLCSLKNEHNPITHSDIGKRTGDYFEWQYLTIKLI